MPERRLAQIVLVLVLAFAALSSGTTELLGLSDERMALFTGLVAALTMLPFLLRPRLDEPSAGVVTLLLLVVAMAALDARGNFDILDYRMLLPILVIAAAPNLARSLNGLDLDRFVWRLLSLYVVGTLAYQTLGEPAAVARGYGGITRYDPTGSVVMHASLATIHLALAAVRAARPRSAAARVQGLLLGACSLALVLSAATRTVLATGALTAVLAVLTSERRAATAGRAALVAATAVGVLAAYTALWDASFFHRLTGAGADDWGSGRGPSIARWVTLLGDHPLGLGLGAVRELLADGKPWLDGAQTLEWPHNELVRFFIEAGPFGLAFVVVFLATLLQRATGAARRATRPERRMLLLVIAADLVAESLLQNLLNAVYHATALVLILCLAAARPEGTPTGPGLAPAPAPS